MLRYLKSRTRRAWIGFRLRRIGAARARVNGVESRRGAVPVARFPSPLIKPDVPISSIRLSDRLHARPTQVSSAPSSSGGPPTYRTQP